MKAMARAIRRLPLAILFVAAIWAGGPAKAAEDTLKLAVGQRGLLDTSISHLGQAAGIFKKHGLVLEILYTQGAGETMQAVISSSVDIGVGAGTSGVLSAFVKNAPVRILSAQATGSAEFWYVPADSSIKSLKEAEGKTIAYSTAGSSTNSMVLALVKQYNPSLKLVATGSPPSTLTQVMSKQVDIGWASPPFGLKEIDEGKIRVVARAIDALEIRNQTMRVNVTNLDALQKKRDQLVRYMRGYRETIAWIYGNEAAFKKVYAEFAGVSEDMAKRIRDEYFPPAMIEPDKIVGLDTAMADAVSQKFIPAPLSEDQIKTLIQSMPGQ